jgi:hypothetical protein
MAIRFPSPERIVVLSVAFLLGTGISCLVASTLLGRGWLRDIGFWFWVTGILVSFLPLASLAAALAWEKWVRKR